MKIDPLNMMGIRGEEKRFEIVDAVNAFIKKNNEMNLTVEQARRISKFLDAAINTSVAESTVKIEELVYCDHYGCPKERP